MGVGENKERKERIDEAVAARTAGGARAGGIYTLTPTWVPVAPTRIGDYRLIVGDCIGAAQAGGSCGGGDGMGMVGENPTGKDHGAHPYGW